MTISEVCMKAQKEGHGIARHKDGPRPPMFIPTNTTRCVYLVTDVSGKDIYPRWEPSLDDLTADDWFVLG